MFGTEDHFTNQRFTTEYQLKIFVDEEAGDLWEWGTDDYTFTEKYPTQTGKFYMNIVAGHIGTGVISGDPNFHDIYYDGESHYYIDGTVLDSGIIPVMRIKLQFLFVGQLPNRNGVKRGV